MNKYITAIRRMNNSLEPICQEYEKRKIYFWINALLAYICYGVTPNEYIGFDFYRLSRLERKRFFTARHQNHIENIFNNREFKNTFCKKQQFNAFFKDFIKREWIYCPDETVEQIQNFLLRHNKVIVKPCSLSSGRGIHVYKNESCEELKAGGYLIEEFVKQHSAITALNSTSVNTVRIYTVMNKEMGISILSAAIRVGGSGSEVDNFHSGGVGYPIDVDSGVICSAGKDIEGKKYLFHPSTNHQMIGFKIPNWEALKMFVFAAAKTIKTARLIAWDVAILEDGFDMIEANYMGDPGFMQSLLCQGKLYDIKKNR